MLLNFLYFLTTTKLIDTHVSVSLLLATTCKYITWTDLSTFGVFCVFFIFLGLSRPFTPSVVKWLHFKVFRAKILV